MAAKNNSAMENPTLLSFERKIDPSDGFMYAVNWDSRKNELGIPISLREKSIRGTISNRMKANAADPAKLNSSIQVANLQTIDIATLPIEKDTLKLRFSVRILGGVGHPFTCNNVDYAKKLYMVTQKYIQETHFDELAMRYACNLANARFLWRNRPSAEMVEVEVRQMRQGAAVRTWTFDAAQFGVQDFAHPTHSGIEELASCIADVLQSEDGFTMLEVTAYARMGMGQEVFPSQELIMSRTKSQKSRTLYQNGGIAAMHSQKIGNALRAVDTWYTGGEAGPLPLEPYASVTSQSKAYRQPKEHMDFYSLLDAWMLRDETPEIEQQHFVMGILIRGGVFGEASKE